MIAYVKDGRLGRVELWAVNTAAPCDRRGEPCYHALFVVADGGKVSTRALGRTSLAAKEAIGRDEVAALDAEIVRRAEGGELDAATGDDAAAVRAELERLTDMDARDVDELLYPTTAGAPRTELSVETLPSPTRESTRRPAQQPDGLPHDGSCYPVRLLRQIAASRNADGDVGNDGH